MQRTRRFSAQATRLSRSRRKARGRAARGRRIRSCRRWKERFTKPPGRLNGSSTAAAPTSTLPVARRGRWSWIGFTPTSSRICARATWCAIAHAILAAMLQLSARNLGPKAQHGGRLHPMSANGRLVWRVCSMSGQEYLQSGANSLIIEAHSAHPHAAIWKAGTASSSGGQSFRASGAAPQVEASVNLHYGSEPEARNSA